MMITEIENLEKNVLVIIMVGDGPAALGTKYHLWAQRRRGRNLVVTVPTRLAGTALDEDIGACCLSKPPLWTR